MTDPSPSLAGEKESHDGERQDPASPAEVPVQEGQPQSQAPRRKRRTKKPATQEVRPNPACSNPACLTTCSPTCENLIDFQDYRQWARAERQAEMGDDPTLRSKDVMP